MHKAHWAQISNVNRLYSGARVVHDAFHDYLKHGFDMPIDCYTMEGTKMRVYQEILETRYFLIFRQDQSCSGRTKKLCFRTALVTMLSYARIKCSSWRLRVWPIAPRILGIHKGVKELTITAENPKM